jgi:streptogramin lyase
MPLSYTTPYACWADKEDNIWQSDIIYNSMVKFDQKTRKFTYVPFPQLLSHTPKIEVDEEGTLWYAPSSRNPANAHDDMIVALKFRGNVPL